MKIDHQLKLLSQQLSLMVLLPVNSCRHRRSSCRQRQRTQHHQQHHGQLQDLVQPSENHQDSCWLQRQHRLCDSQLPSRCRRLHPMLNQNRCSQELELQSVRRSVPHHNLNQRLCQQRESRGRDSLANRDHPKLSCNPKLLAHQTHHD